MISCSRRGKHRKFLILCKEPLQMWKSKKCPRVLGPSLYWRGVFDIGDECLPSPFLFFLFFSSSFLVLHQLIGSLLFSMIRTPRSRSIGDQIRFLHITGNEQCAVEEGEGKVFSWPGIERCFGKGSYGNSSHRPGLEESYSSVEAGISSHDVFSPRRTSRISKNVAGEGVGNV